MFIFDEELFEKAYSNIQSAKQVLLEKQMEIKELDISILDSNNQNDIQTVCDDTKKILDELEDMIDRIENIKKANESMKNSNSMGSSLTSQDAYSNVFSDMFNQFGSNQVNALNLYEKYIDDPSSLTDIELKKVKTLLQIFENYGIDSSNRIDYLLTIAANSGCGHAVLTNILCDLYKDNPEEFEKEYGYPLYYEEDGNIIYNFEVIFTDMFLSMNKDDLDRLDYQTYDSTFVMTMLGYSLYETDLSFQEMADAFRSVIGDDNCSVVSLQRESSIKVYKEYIEKKGYDYACIGVQSFTLVPYGSNSGTEELVSDGGHWMQIIGVSENNNFIVSSWGKEWELVDYSPYLEDKHFFIQPKNEKDGGLFFFKVGE